MTLYLIGFINGLMIFSLGIITVEGYKLYLKNNEEIIKLKKMINDKINDKFIYDEIN